MKEKNNKLVTTSRICDKAKKKAIENIKYRIKEIQKSPNALTVGKYNSTILGLHNYYKIATNVSSGFSEIDFYIRKTLENRLKSSLTNRGDPDLTYKRIYGKYKGKINFINNKALFPVYGIKHQKPMNLPTGINNYTKEGRKTLHENIKGADIRVLKYMLANPIKSMTTEYNDNRMSLFVGQNGRCKITKQLLTPHSMESHHIIPKSLGGTDEYKNLVFITREVHKLVHATNEETIKLYLEILKLDKEQIAKVNKYREKVGNNNI